MVVETGQIEIFLGPADYYCCCLQNQIELLQPLEVYVFFSTTWYTIKYKPVNFFWMQKWKFLSYKHKYTMCTIYYRISNLYLHSAYQLPELRYNERED